MIEKMKSNLLAGIATIVPLALTVYVIQVTLEITIWLGGTVAEPLERFVDVTFPGFGLISSLVGLLIVLIALIIFGALARNVFGKRVVDWFEGIKKIDKEISESVKNALEAPEPPSKELTKYIWAED